MLVLRMINRAAALIRGYTVACVCVCVCTCTKVQIYFAEKFLIYFEVLCIYNILIQNFVREIKAEFGIFFMVSIE